MEWALALIVLANSARSIPLVEDPLLTQAAYERAEYLCTHELSHAGWEQSFIGTTYKHKGENIAQNFSSAKKEHKALMASPTHKNNILALKYSHIGVAHVRCPKNTFGNKKITVQLFGGNGF